MRRIKGFFEGRERVLIHKEKEGRQMQRVSLLIITKCVSEDFFDLSTTSTTKNFPHPPPLN